MSFRNPYKLVLCVTKLSRSKNYDQMAAHKRTVNVLHGSGIRANASAAISFVMAANQRSLAI